MRNVSISNLQGQNFTSFYRTYLESFSDYSVPYYISEEQLKVSLQQVAYDPSLSFGAFEKSGRMVGFWLSGYEGMRDEKKAYGIGTGVIPHKRRGGIVKKLFAGLEREIIRRKIGQYSLDVDCDNVAAVECYKTCGFEIDHLLHSYQAEVTSFSDERKSRNLQLRRASLEELSAIYESYLDYQLCWPNTMGAMRRVRNSTKVFVVEGGGLILGYGIFQPARCRISQIGGLDEESFALAARMLLRGFSKYVDGTEPFQIMSIPDGAQTTTRILQEVGFVRCTSQHMMIKKYLI